MPFHVVSPDYKSDLEIFTEYCAARGLTPEILDPLQGELLTIDAASRALGNGVFGLKAHGARCVYVFPTGDGRVKGRVFYDPGFTPKPGQTVRKPPKYYAPKGSANRIFIPPHLTDWANPDVSYPLYIVEGELAAVKLAAHGYHAIASGLYTYRIGDKSTPIIPELKALIQAKNVTTVTVFADSDTADPENPDKRDLWVAVHKLQQEIVRLRPDRRDTIYTCRPPALSDGSKQGPDDYLHRYGLDAFNQILRESSQRYEDDPYLRLEAEYLTRFIWNESTGRVFDTKLRQEIEPYHANHIMMTGGKVFDITSGKPKPIFYQVANLLAAPGVRIAQGQRFQPDEDDIYFEREGVHYINKSQPEDFPTPLKGDVSIAYEMLKSICRDSPSAIQKIITIAARHAQLPAATPKYAILLTGEQRAGKSNFAKLIGHSLSHKFHNAKADLRIAFNDHWRGYACKEWAELHKDMDEEWLKDLITGEEYEVNGKNKQPYAERNYTLNVFTANGLRSKIQEGDGRFVIGGYAKPDDKRLGLAFEEWVNGPGPQYFRYHLLNDIDVSDYDTMNTWTELRDAVIDASKDYKATVKDYIMHDIEATVPELECIPNNVLELMLEPHRVNTITFNKQYGQYFVKPKHEMVKINGYPIRFRAFKNLDFWRNEAETDDYRKQYELAQVLLKREKF